MTSVDSARVRWDKELEEKFKDVSDEQLEEMAYSPDPVGVPAIPPAPVMREFETGANRDLDDTKLDLEGFLCPAVLQRFGEYMHKKRETAAGVRDSDNWQKGMPLEVYMKSLFRHFHNLWLNHRGIGQTDIEEDLCGIMFNTMGYLHEILKEKRANPMIKVDPPEDARLGEWVMLDTQKSPESETQYQGV